MARSLTGVAPPRAQEELVANIMAVPAVIGLIAAAVEFFLRASGVAWTSGAGLQLFGTVALTGAALLVGRLSGGALRTTFTLLILLGAALTALAAFFLESTFVLIAMLALLVCWLLFVLIAR
ncbi:hypothetical protein [Paracoccus shanxieyensis]|uniref:Uncharacterized protein n=1 Tax=Paracoccus shanxieyensis TaxID=2675752 RepID=A0A6L6J047_9RHOB|nr:hypothetical protein [Paracoccus shanxieyensis]MTH65913.1 hypothetical protein [Paracoccus shanxieyensis]MTH89178.1 hypothetical protein [Paracoccus shanxieyensis]